MSQQDIDRQIREFYDAYHTKRSRTAPSWIERDYWRLFEGRTLEVGPGTLVPHNFADMDYVAIECSQVAARMLADRGVHVVTGDGQNLPFENCSFDTVACHDVVEHVADPEKLIAEMARVSKNKVIVVGPNYVGPGRKVDGKLQPVWLRFFRCGVLTRQHRKVHHLPNPRFVLDESWESDADAVSGVNVWWVVRQLQRRGFKNITWRTQGHMPRSRLFRLLPFRKLIGFMMFVVARRE